jgi:hypothetical protein
VDVQGGRLPCHTTRRIAITSNDVHSNVESRVESLIKAQTSPCRDFEVVESTAPRGRHNYVSVRGKSKLRHRANPLSSGVNQGKRGTCGSVSSKVSRGVVPVVSMMVLCSPGC